MYEQQPDRYSDTKEYIMQSNTEFRHPTADEINQMVQEAHRLRAQAFRRSLAKLGRMIKGTVYPKGTGTAAKAA